MESIAPTEPRLDRLGRPVEGRGRPRYGAFPGEDAIRDELIAPMAQACLTPRQIAASLNHAGVPTRHGGPWRHSTIERIIARLRAVGSVAGPSAATDNVPGAPPSFDNLAKLLLHLSPRSRRTLLGDLVLHALRYHVVPVGYDDDALRERLLDLGSTLAVLGLPIVAAEATDPNLVEPLDAA